LLCGQEVSLSQLPPLSSAAPQAAPARRSMQWIKEQASGLTGMHKREALTQFVNLGEFGEAPPLLLAVRRAVVLPGGHLRSLQRVRGHVT